MSCSAHWQMSFSKGEADIESSMLSSSLESDCLFEPSNPHSED